MPGKLTPRIKRFIAAWNEGEFDADVWDQMSYTEHAIAELEMHNVEYRARQHGQRIARNMRTQLESDRAVTT